MKAFLLAAGVGGPQAAKPPTISSVSCMTSRAWPEAAERETLWM